DAFHVGGLNTEIVDRDPEPAVAQYLDENRKRLLRRRLLLGHFADDAARVDTGFVKGDAHLVQDHVGNLERVENRRIEIDEQHLIGIEEPARVEEVDSPRQRFDVQPVGHRVVTKEIRGRDALLISKRPDQPFICDDIQLSVAKGEYRLESRLEHIGIPYARGSAVILFLDVRQDYAA